jgi:hypothetical protein
VYRHAQTLARYVVDSRETEPGTPATSPSAAALADATRTLASATALVLAADPRSARAQLAEASTRLDQTPPSSALEHGIAGTLRQLAADLGPAVAVA